MTTINPLPSLIRASAWDAANMRMRAAGRTSWNRADYNHAAATQKRLVLACYGKPHERDSYPMACIRFGMAEKAERDGIFTLKSDFRQIFAAINAALAA